jgi:hypothetical protein
MMRTIPEFEHYFVEVELPPGQHIVHSWGDQNGDHNPRIIETNVPIVVWQEIFRRAEIIEKKLMKITDWRRGAYVVPSWWRRLWNSPREPVVPHARVVTR